MALIWALAALKQRKNNMEKANMGSCAANASPDAEPSRLEQKCLCLRWTRGITVCRVSRTGEQVKACLNIRIFWLMKAHILHIPKEQKEKLVAWLAWALSTAKCADYQKTCRRKGPTLYRLPLLGPCSHPAILVLVLLSDRLLLTNMHDSPANHRAFHIHWNTSLPF